MVSFGQSIGIAVAIFLVGIVGVQFFRDDVIRLLGTDQRAQTTIPQPRPVPSKDTIVQNRAVVPPWGGVQTTTTHTYSYQGGIIGATKEDLLREKENLQLRLANIDKRLTDMTPVAYQQTASPVPAKKPHPTGPGSEFLLRDEDSVQEVQTSQQMPPPTTTPPKAKVKATPAPTQNRLRTSPKDNNDAVLTVSTPSAMKIPSTLVSASSSSSATSNCRYRFKVYVYPIPTELASVRLGEEARQNGTLHICHKCILEQFSLEYIIYDFFTQFCGRTDNPDEADYFYLPLVRDAEYRLTMEEKGPRKRAPSPTEQALLDVIEKGNFAKWLEVFQVSDKYWKARSGADHIIVMPAPVTNLRHESSKRGYFHYMVHLYPPIFVGVEYSASFIREYPVCATKKNIMVPYPTTDHELYNGKLIHEGSVKRENLIYYAGGVHGDCVEIRQAMKRVMINSTRIPGVVPDVKSNMAEREHGFRAAVFCPIPVGDSPSSKRMYDVMNFGCIPVVLSDDLVWAYDSFTGGTLNRSTFSFQMPQAVVQFSAEKLLARYKSEPHKFGYLPSGESLYEILVRANKEGAAYRTVNGISVYVNPLVQILERISKDDIAFLQRGVAAAAPSYRFYSMNSSMSSIPTAKHAFPDGGAMEIFADMIQAHKDRGIVNVYKECKAEKERPGHGYLHRYPCEPNDRRRLVQNDNQHPCELQDRRRLLHDYFGAR
jgi:hypothetical protein